MFQLIRASKHPHSSTRRANERKEQYKQVRAHVKKEDGRMQAYGWSLPANKPQGSSVASSPTSEDSTSSSRIGANVPVPVPVYCRPLMEKEPGMKVISFKQLAYLLRIIIVLHFYQGRSQRMGRSFCVSRDIS